MPISFQSTPPVKAATLSFLTLPLLLTISIHAAREGGDASTFSKTPVAGVISIHAAREGGDIQYGCLPAVFEISIHAAREGGDRQSSPFSDQLRHFNPRRP